MKFIQHKGLVALFLFIVSFGVFAPSLKNRFVWDDHKFIEQRSSSINASHITYKMLIPGIGKSKRVHYRPIMSISYVMDKGMWGVSPFGFHLSNIIFHSISTVLFYFMVLLVLGGFRVDRKKEMAFLSSLLFALYPVHVEAVSFVSARSDLLCSIFFFLAFIFYILSQRRLWFLILTAFCFYLSLLSKEVAVAFPIVAIGFDLISRRFASRESILRYSILGISILAYLYLRGRAYVIIPGVFSERFQLSVQEVVQIWEVLKVLLSSYLFYIKKLVFPFNINPFITILSISFYYLVSSILVVILLCIIGFVSIRKREGVTAFGILWILATLGPSSLVAIFSVATMSVAERFLYIPSAGFCMLLGYFVIAAGKRMKSQKTAWALGSLICIFYLFFTIWGQSIWKDDLSLWGYASKRSPYDAIPHSNYAEALNSLGKMDQAIEEFLIALNQGVRGTKKEKAAIANNLGHVYMDKKKEYSKAEEWFLKAVNYDPKYKPTYYHLGLVYFLKGQAGNSVSDYRKAENYLNKALYYKDTRVLLSMVYSVLGEKEKAGKLLEENVLKRGPTKPLSNEGKKYLENR
ncbi:MAG: hypothetical protein ACREOW_17630 [Thermodesulfobacteriota bacterium]